MGQHLCDRVDQLPLFPYNRGWETQPNVLVWIGYLGNVYGCFQKLWYPKMDGL